MAALMALTASVCWGIGDYILGYQARRTPVLAVATVAQYAGVVLIVAIVAARGVPPPSAGLSLIGVATGAFGAATFVGIITALSMGNMARVAPVLGLASVIPVAIGLARGEDPAAIQLIGIVVAILGVVLVSTESAVESADDRDRSTRRALVVALLSAAGTGLVFSGLDHVSDYDPYWATFFFRATICVILTIIALVALMTGRVRLSALHLSVVPLLAFGVLDTVGNSIWAVASTEGLLSVVSVLGSLFPAVTVGLALVLRKDPLDRLQAVGVVTVIVGTALIAGGG